MAGLVAKLLDPGSPEDGSGLVAPAVDDFGASIGGFEAATDDDGAGNFNDAGSMNCDVS